MKPLDERDRALLRDVVLPSVQAKAFPVAPSFRAIHKGDRDRLTTLVRLGWLAELSTRYVVTIAGLRALALSDDLAAQELYRVRNIYHGLQALFAELPNIATDASDLAKRLPPFDHFEVGRAASVILASSLSSGPFSGWSIVPENGFIGNLTIGEAIIDQDPFDEPSEAVGTLLGWSGSADDVIVESVTVDGYGPLANAETDLGPVRVVVGANAAGKSSFAAAMAWLGRTRDESIAPDFDRTAKGRNVFRVGGDASITIRARFALLGIEPRVEYVATVNGPAGHIAVASEEVTIGDQTVIAREGNVVRYFGGLKGHPEAERNELLLRGFDRHDVPALNALTDHLRGWRVFNGFDVSPESPVRFSGVSDVQPSLEPNGHNLVAVLVHLWSKHRDDVWPDLEQTLRAVIPGFLSIRMEPVVGPGRWGALWRENGVDKDLTLADLSDGTLLLLAWAALLLAPSKWRLLILDEPERGLHPRAIGVLAGLIRQAGTTSQVVVLTHSPDLVSRFPLTDIRVVRRENGVATIVRPDASEALRQIEEELGATGLANAFRSGELEQLP